VSINDVIQLDDPQLCNRLDCWYARIGNRVHYHTLDPDYGVYRDMVTEKLPAPGSIPEEEA